MENITAYLIQSTVNTSEVRAWEEIVKLPTYETGVEEKNPLFIEKRVYQGSSGSVYPYPVIEKISDEKKDREYKALFIENEYIKVMILPELGGRVHMAYDKVKERHFVYYNQVVKPALVGLVGPWISGGIEFNWPQHHRPSTFLPTDYQIERFEDGSVTVWCSEVERMFRTKGMAGFTLYPGKSYIEIKAKVYNRTPYPQTFLWWANPAVVVNDDYYSVFPPDVNAVFDHGKRAVSSFPIATGEYYKYDYSAGVDISRYKNIPVPTSYMSVNSKYDFVGGYEEHSKAGLLHVSDHHVSTGKKQWTWGCGDFGKAWDRCLTDEDGPYIELMTGVYCDNQPDFTWLQPYEQKTWTQYFMPYQAVGMVKNATRDAVVNVEAVEEDKVGVYVYTTAAHKNARVLLTHNDTVLIDKLIATSPSEPFVEIIDRNGIELTEVKLTVTGDNGVTLVKYEAEVIEEKPIPYAAKAAKMPADIESIEQLFLTGHHIEQYRHATYLATDYYEEALRREPGDIRCNNAMGLLMLRRGQFAKAQEFFERALETQTDRNPNPYDGEPCYNLGCAKKMQGDIDGAYSSLFKATWNAAWQDAGYFALAQIDMMRGDLNEALDHIDRSLVRNWCNHKGRQLKTSVLRRMGNIAAAEKLIADSLELDLFNIGCLYESYIISNLKGATAEAQETKAKIKEIMHSAVHSYMEYAIDYINAGMYQEAIELMHFLVEENAAQYPMLYFAIGYSYSQMGDAVAAKAAYATAEAQSPLYCFPNKLEEVLFLEDAKRVNPEGSKAPYYLGNFWYGARQYDNAIADWSLSASLDDTFSTCLRNLSLAYYNKQKDSAKALTTLEKAFALDRTDARIFMELDQLYKIMGVSAAERLENFVKYPELVEQRDDMCVELARLYNQTEQYQKAYDLIAGRMFHAWEGGEGNVTRQYVVCRIELAKIAIEQGNCDRAIELLLEAEVYPENLGEGKLLTTDENDLHYYLGCAYQAKGDAEMAKKYFTIATFGSNVPTIAYYYNDRQPDKIFYQGLAYAQLGETAKSIECFNNLVAHGEKHLDEEVIMDYFAVSMPELLIWEGSLNTRNNIHCLLVLGLGYLGLGNNAKATDYLKRALALDCNNFPALFALEMCK
ncbi:MAG: DUF5107 domain-containing protein [Rikenellaceae bacterium]